MRRSGPGWLICGAVALAATLLGAPARAADFRFSNWGDSLAAVRQAETAPFHHQRTDELAFVDSEIDGIDGGIIYLFERGLLVQGVYVSRDEYRGGEGAMDDYSRMRHHFEAVLGATGEEEIRWIDEEPQDATGDALVEAVVSDRVRVTTSWTVGRTRTELIMSGKEGGVFLRAVSYPSE